MDNKIRSEYIKNLVSEKDALKKKLEEMANESLKDIVSEEVNKNLANLSQKLTKMMIHTKRKKSMMSLPPTMTGKH